MAPSIENALSKLDGYCRRSNYRGWDLYDGLNSKPFRRSTLYRSELLRLAWIQFFKRSPLNFRKLACVPKDYNPKGLGLFASGLIALRRFEEAKDFLDRLKDKSCGGVGGSSWGYNFPWQARAFFVPVGTPNMVTTVFVANAFLDYFEVTGDAECLSIAEGSCEFILRNLILFEDDESLCFGYIPGEGARVHNANMLGAALLGRVYSHNGEESYLEKSRKAMVYSMNALSEEYFWPYGELSHHRFIDNFHTGFNLVALRNWRAHTGESTWGGRLSKAYKVFLDHFWVEDGCPKYFHNALYPIDIHCSAQGIVTCLKLAEYDDRSMAMAQEIAQWAIDNMQDEEGYFYYQKTSWYTNKIPYIRWAQAWMFYALSLYCSRVTA